MAVEKKFLSSPYIKVKKNDQRGDLSKLWYVHWREGGRTRKKYGNLKRIKDLESRRAALEELRIEWEGEINFNVFKTIYAHLDQKRIDLRWRKKSYYSRKSQINTVATWCKGKGQVTKALLTECFLEFRRKYHPVTFNRRFSDCKTLFEECGLMAIWPDTVKRIPKAKAKSRPARNFTKDDIATLKRAIINKDPKLWLAIQYMFNCAIRPTELRQLQRKHVYIDLHSILIPSHIAKTNYERYAEIPDNFLETVREHIRGKMPIDYLFPSPKDPSHYVSHNYFTSKLRPIMRAHGFDSDYRPCYSWRNTAAIKGVEEDEIPLWEMKEAWGHRSIEQFVQYLRRIGARRKKIYAAKFTGI
ncbi:MAG: tyrosine-type recombinase/integrase [Bacteroidota bacterium]